MLRVVDSFLAEKSVRTVASLSFVLILLLAMIDHLTGNEVSFSVFYLIPISIAVWYGGSGLGYIASGASGIAWMIVEGTTGQPYSQQWILFWNAAVRTGFFTIFVYLITELRTHLRLERQLARTDALTGLLNRAGFVDRAGAVISAASRYEHAVAIAYIDLDGFKRINDTLGHSQGDEALKSIGGLLDRSSRQSDIVARIGGDEFAILLPNTDLRGAQTYFENLHSVLQNEIAQRHWTSLGVSIGAAVFERGPSDLSEALHIADSLMYRAKRTGESRVVVESAARGDPTDAGSAVSHS